MFTSLLLLLYYKFKEH